MYSNTVLTTRPDEKGSKRMDCTVNSTVFINLQQHQFQVEPHHFAKLYMKH